MHLKSTAFSLIQAAFSLFSVACWVTKIYEKSAERKIPPLRIKPPGLQFIFLIAFQL